MAVMTKEAAALAAAKLAVVAWNRLEELEDRFGLDAPSVVEARANWRSAVAVAELLIEEAAA